MTPGTYREADGSAVEFEQAKIAWTRGAASPASNRRYLHATISYG